LPELVEGNIAIGDNMKGWMYILECIDGSYYTGSTNDLELRVAQHQAGEGANHTKKRLPVKLVYYEEFQRIDDAFNREKQIQGWGRKKKDALINGNLDRLPLLAKNHTQCSEIVASTSSATVVRLHRLNEPVA
jgi:putative endonuclease